MNEALNLLTIRKKQALAALCLAKFCSVYKITHHTIIELIEHLLNILIAQNLNDWEDKGTRLAITGRGDPLPKSLNAIIPKDKYDLFSHLVECVVEVGIVDMYGATTNEPLKFLNESIKILIRCGIEPPSIDKVFQIQQNDIQQENGWGEPIGTDEYKDILKNLGEVWGTP